MRGRLRAGNTIRTRARPAATGRLRHRVSVSHLRRGAAEFAHLLAQLGTTSLALVHRGTTLKPLHKGPFSQIVALRVDSRPHATLETTAVARPHLDAIAQNLLPQILGGGDLLPRLGRLMFRTRRLAETLRPLRVARPRLPSIPVEPPWYQKSS